MACVDKLVVLSLFVFIAICNAQGRRDYQVADPNSSVTLKDEKSLQAFRQDYKQLEGLDSYYKIHMSPQPWRFAKFVCDQEAASLFYPENTDEADAVISFWKLHQNSTQPDDTWLYVGMSDIIYEGVYETVKGKSISEVYNNWKDGQPDNNYNEDCINMNQEGHINDIKCDAKYIFICKKSLPSDCICKINQSEGSLGNAGRLSLYEAFATGYKQIEGLESFYKIHMTPKPWRSAKLECDQEGASLFYPENTEEANAVISFWKQHQYSTKPDDTWLYVGMSDIISEGLFETVKGKAISDVYSNWKDGQPDDYYDEDCIQINQEGRINDIKCDAEFIFICKKSLRSDCNCKNNQSEGSIGPTSGIQCQKSRTVVAGRSPVCKGDLVFSEEFNGSGLRDLPSWTAEVRFPEEPDYPFNVYDPDKTITFKDGSLVITPVLTESQHHEGFLTETLDLTSMRCTGVLGTTECRRTASGAQILPPVITGKITTRHRFGFKYGKIDVRAKLPAGSWLVPEINLEPAENVYGSLRYESGLMRVAFSRGNPSLAKKLYGGPVLSNSEPFRTMLMKEKIGIDNWNKEYHNYTMIWKPDGLQLLVDGEEYGNINPGDGFFSIAQENAVSHASNWLRGTVMAPLDETFYISLGLRVGGINDFPDDLPDKPWRNLASKAMFDFWKDRNSWYPSWYNTNLRVDSIKVYAL